jgi:hypothetical protein
MENGAVYWSNWAGLSDVTTSNHYEVQEVLGSSKLAYFICWGNFNRNVITRTSEMKEGGSSFYFCW